MAIDKIRGELGEMPTEANEIIKFLNSKTKEELEDLKVEGQNINYPRSQKSFDQKRIDVTAGGESPEHRGQSSKVFQQDRGFAEERTSWFTGPK
jgi:hypothetical protein